MRIDLDNGGWLEGEAVLTKTECGCPTCTCPPFWDIRLVAYLADGKQLFYSCHGAQNNTEEGSNKELVKDMERWQNIYNSKIK